MSGRWTSFGVGGSFTGGVGDGAGAAAAAAAAAGVRLYGLSTLAPAAGVVGSLGLFVGGSAGFGGGGLSACLDSAAMLAAVRKSVMPGSPDIVTARLVAEVDHPVVALKCFLDTVHEMTDVIIIRFADIR